MFVCCCCAGSLLLLSDHVIAVISWRHLFLAASSAVSSQCAGRISGEAVENKRKPEETGYVSFHLPACSILQWKKKTIMPSARRSMLSLLLLLLFFFFLAPHLFLKLCACIALLSPVLGFVSLVLDSAFVTFIVLLLYWICCCCCSCSISSSSSSGIGVIASRKRKTGRIEFNAATTTRIIINSFVCSPRAYLYLEMVVGREK